MKRRRVYPNHRGMPVLDKDDKLLDFLRKQVHTSWSVCSTWLFDFLKKMLQLQSLHQAAPLRR